MEARAPGVLKLLGEHASVYGRLAVLASIDRYVTASVKQGNPKMFTVRLDDLGGMEVEFSRRMLEEIYDRYKNKIGIMEYINDMRDIDYAVLPYATIASRLVAEQAMGLDGKHVTITSDIKMKSGMGSSGACATAFTTAMLRAGRKRIDDAQVIDVARDGERIAHKNINAGGIDAGTSYYGGYVSYSNATGPKKEDFATKLDLLIVDTGPKKGTAETVGHVAELYKKDRNRVERILDKIQECSTKGLNCLKMHDIATLGACMYMDHELLKELEVSSEGLDAAVEMARKNGAYGAKLSGGGGGGIAVVLMGGPTNREQLLKDYEGAGFKTSRADMSLEGAYNYLPR